MSFLETLLIHQFGVFVLVLARVGGLVMTAPIFGSRAAPINVRAILAFTLSLLVTPLCTSRAVGDVNNMLAFSRYIVNEALVGMLLGLGLIVLFSGVQLTGQIISQLGGTALADSFDPNVDDNVPVHSQLLYFLTLTMFVLLDGHRALTEAVLDTYVWLPPGAATLGESFGEVLTTLLSQSFVLGIRAAAPAMAALLLATLLLALISRTLPQVNILAVGFSLNAILTPLCMMASLGAIAWAFPQYTLTAIDLISDAIRAATDIKAL